MLWTIIDRQIQFLIQADFDTSANRQDVTTSRRNMRLLEAIANTFVKAVLQFCKHPALCYTWPMFLPSVNDLFSPMWAGVVKNIRTLLSTTPILKTRHSKELRMIDKVVILLPELQDDNAEPLLDCEVEDPFLSGDYLPDSVEILQQYGLKRPRSRLLFDLLRLDLERRSSTMRSNSTSADWHSRIARLLIKYSPRHQTEIRELTLLPLRHGGGLSSTKFVAADHDQVYLPYSGGVIIPTCLNLSVLDATAVANEDRKALFVQLGAVEASAAIMRAKVLQSSALSESSIAVGSSKEALDFLYLTHQPTDSRGEFNDISIWNADGLVTKPHQEEIYLPSTHAYGAEALFKGLHGASEFRVAFVHSVYLEDIPASTQQNHPSWKRWLYDYVGIRKRVRLLTQDGSNLSNAWILVTKHRHEKVLGLLEYLWKYEGTKITTSSALKAMIAETNATKLCGKELLFPCTLGETYMPFPNLRQLCEHYMEPNEQFPFLNFEDLESTETLSTKWMFLHTNFGVGKDDCREFLLSVLQWIKILNPKASLLRRQQRVMDLYVAIDAKCTADLQRSGISRSTL